MINKIKGLFKSIFLKLKNPSCTFSSGASISRKAILGSNIKFGEKCKVGSNVFLGDNTIVGAYISLNNVSIGNNCQIESGVRIVGTGKGKIIIGKECYIGVYNILDNSDNITIGDFVHIAGPSTALWCHSSAQMCMHSIPLNATERDRYRPTAPIKIENNVYIGGNCTIYPGIVIGHHSIVAPNSAISKNILPYKMVGGVPGRIIKELN